MASSFQGVRYGERDLVKRAVSNLGIDPSLVPRMYAYAADRTQTLQDMRKAKIALQMVCKGCMTLQDYRDALPNEMIEHVQGLKDYSRTRPEAYHLMSDPMKMQQYQKLRDHRYLYGVQIALLRCQMNHLFSDKPYRPNTVLQCWSHEFAKTILLRYLNPFNIDPPSSAPTTSAGSSPICQLAELACPPRHRATKTATAPYRPARHW